jgi:transcriptional regulator with XRE-family HTH domain
MDSVHPLKVWIDRHTTAASFAADVGITASYLSEILSDKKTPSLKLAFALSAATKGVVAIGEFMRGAS